MLLLAMATAACSSKLALEDTPSQPQRDREHVGSQVARDREPAGSGKRSSGPLGFVDEVAPDPAVCTIPSGEDYREIEGRDLASRARVSLCQLVHSDVSGGGGMYIVESLTGVAEMDLYPGGDISGFTYVKLRLVDPWFDAEEQPIARIFGGPYPNQTGESGGWSIRLEIGQIVGVTFRRADPGNRNCRHMSMPGIFAQRADGSYTNDELFTDNYVDELELTRLVRETHAMGSCDIGSPTDVAADSGDAGPDASPPSDEDDTGPSPP